MKHLYRWLLSAIIIYVLGSLDLLVSVDSIKTAVIVSVLISLIAILVRIILWFITIVGGVLTAGILSLVGMILFIFVTPFAIYKAAELVQGFEVNSFISAIILAIILSLLLPKKGKKK